MNELNIIDFLFAKSYDSFEIIDENFSNVVINKNKNIIVPNDLILLTINSVAPYDQAISECVDLFAQNHNITLNENILSSPHIFGALLISNENNDLFKDYYEFKNYMLNESLIDVNTDNRIEIFAQYLLINESLNENILLEEFDKFMRSNCNYSTNIGTFDQLYSLSEGILSNLFEKNMLNKVYNNRRGVIQALKQWGAKTYSANIDDINVQKIPGDSDHYAVSYKKSVKNKVGDKDFVLADNSQVFIIDNNDRRGNFRIKKVEHDKLNNKRYKASLMDRFENRVGNGIINANKWLSDPKRNEELKRLGAKGKELASKVKNKIKNVDWKKKKEDLRKIYNKGKESGKKIFKTAANDVKESFSAWNKARHTLGNSILTGRRASHLI